MADAFEQAWFAFLGTLNSIPEILKTGTRDDPRARPWYGQKEHEIRTDPLLRYLFHSRGGDYHGPERVMILRLSHGSHEYPEVTLDGPLPVHGILDIPDHVSRVVLWYELQPVHDKNNNTFNPPDTHLGHKILLKFPCNLASLALDYYESVIREAEAFVA
jgi:hypothetical protein